MIMKRLQFVRQFFAYAVRCEWIETNPFATVSHKGGDPRERQRYITKEDTRKPIEAAPNWIWRTIIALARYGGLRTPSETLSLPLANLDWEHGAMTVICAEDGRPRAGATSSANVRAAAAVS